MGVAEILILIGLALLGGFFRRGRKLILLALSAAVVFWLQPGNDAIPSLAFWIPFTTLAVTVLAWVLTVPPEARGWKENLPAGLALGAVVLLVDLDRYVPSVQIFTDFLPLPLFAGLAIAGVFLLIFVIGYFQGGVRFFQTLLLLGILAVFVFLKTPHLAGNVLSAVSAWRGRPLAADATAALAWMGYSYLAFRLIHTIRDRQTGRLPAVDLAEYVNYVIFFPAFTAGPIDRLERFIADLRSPQALTSEDWLFVGKRLAMGLFKKFVLADLLAVVSITDALVDQTRTGGWLWVLLYAYAFRIYFDFSGYTDIAIGMGRLMGIRLPENFAAPYLKPNLTQFWNSWHMTLTQWFRSYFFNPLTRSMRAAKRPLPVWSMILLSQLSTMILIGLWHGITWNFVLWGVWHGLGLFIHNRWSDFMRERMPAWSATRLGSAVIHGAGALLTFHFVALGWVFFSLSSPGVSWLALLKLLGVP
ncbi:MAG: MBOAT family O-acyltransferase [Chloroflexota bacterium]